MTEKNNNMSYNLRYGTLHVQLEMIGSCLVSIYKQLEKLNKHFEHDHDDDNPKIV